MLTDDQSRILYAEIIGQKLQLDNIVTYLEHQLDEGGLYNKIRAAKLLLADTLDELKSRDKEYVHH